MRAKVIKPYNDRMSGKYQAVGKEIEVTPERFAEINRFSQHLVKVDKVTEPKKKAAKKTVKTENKADIKKAEKKAEE